MEALIGGRRQELENQPDELGKLLASMGIDMKKDYEKGYTMTEAFIREHMDSEDRLKYKAILAYANMKLQQSIAHLDLPYHQDFVSTVYRVFTSMVNRIVDSARVDTAALQEKSLEFYMSATYLNFIQGTDSPLNEHIPAAELVDLFNRLHLYIDTNDDTVMAMV
jgi:hypothetical protein